MELIKTNDYTAISLVGLNKRNYRDLVYTMLYTKTL